MNEYQDQTLWFEVQWFKRGRWVFFSDHDTFEDASDWKIAYSEVYPRDLFRVKRVYGLSD